MVPRLALLSILVAFAVDALGQSQWCGKNYMASQPVVPPGGEFPIPGTSSTPLIAFRCAPAIKPYLPEDVSSPAGFIIDTIITHTRVAGAKAISLPTQGALGSLDVIVKMNGQTLAQGRVPANLTKFELPFSLASLSPQKDDFDVSCSASYSTASGETQTFSASTKLSFLPPPPAGRSVTKMDLRTGALLAKPATGKGGEYATVFPIGFYTDFGGYLASNLSVLDDLKDRGFTIVHPVPTFDNLTALDLVIDRMQELGLWLMYDMRWTYLLSNNVTEEVNRIKNRPNLLLWYTGDEPDGWQDPLNGTSVAYDLIYSLDGYHPVSLVLNCENYHFDAYTAGSDIVMQDTYMIGNNVTFSSVWGTPCTADFGDCGCDNCRGGSEDISTRMDEFAERLWILGWDQTKAVWTVPQAFGGSSYWKRVPTGKEWVVQSVLGINHGGLGVVPWNDPTTADIKNSATSLAKALLTMKEFILSPAATIGHAVVNRVDVTSWTVGSETLVLATNLNYNETTVPLSALHDLTRGSLSQQVFDSGAKVQGEQIVLDSVGTGGWIFH